MSMHEESIFNYSLANNGSIGSNELLKNTYRVVILGKSFHISLMSERE
jgi:hypothetical protein